MRIYAFAQHYPTPYKPYYDAHFADLVRRGHELRVFAFDEIDRVRNQKVVRFGLAERTRYVPGTLHTLLPRLPAILAGAARLGMGAAGRARAAAAAAPGPKLRLVAAARALALGPGRPDLCIVHGLGTATLFPWLRRVFAGVPVALYYHGGEVPMAPRLGEDSAAQAFAAADIVFTNTEFSRGQAIARGCPADRVSVLPVGFALEDYNPRPDRGYRPGGVLRLVSAGRMSEEKGLLYALEAVKQVVAAGEHRISYVIAGAGYGRSLLEAFVREHDLSAYVSFPGVLANGAVIEAMAGADVLLLPSVPLGNWAETQACAVQEAMLMGALVVTTRAGGVPESIPPEMRRFSVPPRNSDALARAIMELARMRPEEMRAVAAACRRFVVERYDVTRLNELLIEQTLQSRMAHVLGRQTSSPPDQLARDVS